MTKQPIAYLTGEYPKVSHTFIQREIEALRLNGWTVEACTIRRAAPNDIVGTDQHREARDTFCVLEAAKRPATLIGAHIWALRRDARAWAKAAGLAWRTRPAGLKAALWQVFYFLEAGVLARHLHDRGVCHIHNHFANSSASVAMLTSEMSGIPFSMTMHGPAIFFEPMHWRIDEKIARAAFVSCISHFCRSQAMYFSDPIHWDKLKIVHCGVVPDDYGHGPRTDRKKRIIFVGRLDPVKGVPLLLDAMARVVRDHRDATLTVVGDGPSRHAVEEQSRALGLGDCVSFLGYRASDEITGLLEEADMLVLPSFAEGVPVVLMEAMASRIPVIASRVAGVSELIEDGVSGFTIPAGDLDTLCARLDTLLSDGDLCIRMGNEGRQKVEADFDLSSEAAWIGALFEGALIETLPDSLRP
ncbi:glycosyltransferase family 4 protein [Celeribacter marinus]|uniref:glycosyltransferase family 4 protein n=1 Tax=Celeribacter marinus TaxID=1397108 RepID=UPI00318255BB